MTRRNAKRRRSKGSTQKARAAIKTISHRFRSIQGGKRKRSRKTHGFSLADGRRNRRKSKNPVRVGAQVVGAGTGWIKAKAVKVRKVKGKGYVVDVKR